MLLFERGTLELWTGLVIIILLGAAALFAPFLSTHAPFRTNPENWLCPPCKEHLFGTDRLGRDLFSRVLYGGRFSMAVGCLSMLLSVGIGLCAGLIAGSYGGIVDETVMRLTDIVLVFPTMLLVLSLIALFEPEPWMVVLVIGGTGWPGIARLVRGEVLQLKEAEFVSSARMLGAGRFRIIRYHLLPNAVAPVLVAATLCVPAAIMMEAGLGYFGVGVQPPVPTWGNMLREAQLYLRHAWWYAFFPGLFLFLTVFGFQLTGEGLRKKWGLSPSVRRG
jgi:peptide/nickel transport system permease protein